MTEAVIIQKPVWFVYDNGLRHERVKKNAWFRKMFRIMHRTTGFLRK